MANELDEIIKAKYTNVLRPGYAVYDGVFMLNNFHKYRDQIKNFQIRDDDIWVSSYAKAGTTWTQEMVWLIANDLDYDGAKVNLPHRFPFLEMNCALNFENYKEVHPEFNTNELPLNIIEILNNIKSRRFIKTHLPWKFLPLQIQNQTTKAKMIYVMRNPKDVCVSYYHHSRAMEGATINLDEFFKLFLAGKVVYGSYWDHVLTFWEKQHLSNLLLITYEHMKSDIRSVIRKVASFLEKEFSDAQIDVLAKHLSFEEMKKNTAVNYEPAVTMIKRCFGDKYESDGIFMRSGIVGSHKTQMTKEMNDAMDEWIEKNIAGTGFIYQSVTNSCNL